MELASVNGQISPLNEAKVSVLDRGFLFGDGIYEVFRIYGGKPFLLEEHFARLERSLKGLELSLDTVKLRESALKLIEKSGEKEATLYIQITRGVRNTRQHAFSTDTPLIPCTEVLFVVPYSDERNAVLRKKGAAATITQDIRWGRVDLKTTNLLGNVLAAQAAKKAGVYEAILVNGSGLITEGSHTNVFCVRDGKLRTYPLNEDVLPGVTRAIVLRLAQENKLNVVEKAVTLDELLTAEEVFVSATTAEIMPITEIDGKKVGSGVPGKVATQLQAAYQNLVKTFLT